MLAGEERVATIELHQRRSEPINLHRRVAIDGGNDALRLLPEGVSRGLNAVAANIHQRSAAPVNIVANVGRVSVEVAEAAHDGAQFADVPLINERAGAQPLRMAADHKGFADFDAGAIAAGQQFLCLGY